jgi:hypothetical protein
LGGAGSVFVPDVVSLESAADSAPLVGAGRFESCVAFDVPVASLACDPSVGSDTGVVGPPFVVVDVGSVEAVALELVVEGPLAGATDVDSVGPVVGEPVVGEPVVGEPVVGEELVSEPQLVISPIPKLTDPSAQRINSRIEPANAPTIAMVRCNIAVTSGYRSA